MKFVLLTIGTVACSIVENCDMQRDALKTSGDKRVTTCVNNGWKSEICQSYAPEISKNAAALKECNDNAKKAAPVPVFNKGGYLEENCDEQMAGYNTCKRQQWKSKSCQIRQKEVVVKAN